MRQSITVIIKITDACNLKCSYCYHFKNIENSKKEILKFKDDNLKILTTFFLTNFSRVDFVWHGGEPLLSGIDFFSEAINLQNSIKKEGQYITNSIQTNGTLLNETWCHFFVKNKFHVGISIDGPEWIHKKYRTVNQSQFSQLEENIRFLNKHNAKFGVLTVVSNSTDEYVHDIYNFYVKNNITGIGFLPSVVQDTQGDIDLDKSISPEMYSDFLVKMFDYWCSSGIKGLQFREFDEVIRAYQNIPMQTCSMLNCEEFLTVASNGDIYLCDCFPFLAKFKIGSIYSTINDIYNNKNFATFTKNVLTIPPECEGCKYIKICNGGCKYHRYLRNKDFKQQSFYCKTTKRIYNHIFNKLDSINKDG